jgi:hypothetical protein
MACEWKLDAGLAGAVSGKSVSSMPDMAKGALN